MSVEVEFTSDGYLRLSSEIARRYFPSDGLVALLRGPEMWLMPTHGNAAGGSLLKQRTAHGDKTVLIGEELRTHPVTGFRIAFWDETQGALRVALDAPVEAATHA
jgi:hydrogenase maturation protease